MRFFLKFKVFIFLMMIIGGGVYLKGSIKTDQVTIGAISRFYEVAPDDFVQKVTLAGQIFPKRRSVINAPFDGYIQKLYVKVGDSVKKGDPIVSIAENLAVKDLSYPIRSPFSGKVVLVNHQEGEFVSKLNSNDFILYIDDLSEFIIKGELPEIDLLKVKKGQPVLVKFSAITSKAYKGIVDEISLAPVEKKDNWGRGSSSYPLMVRILDADKNIRVGLSSVMDVITYEKKNVMTLPHEFIKKEGDKYFAFNENGSKREIKVGHQNEYSFEVISGLEEGFKAKQIDFFNADLTQEI